jgi:hypothetical protein
MLQCVHCRKTPEQTGESTKEQLDGLTRPWWCRPCIVDPDRNRPIPQPFFNPYTVSV